MLSLVVEGPLKKLYERIRSQRENWQQRTLHESHDTDAVVDRSHSESAVHQTTLATYGRSAESVYVFYAVFHQRRSD